MRTVSSTRADYRRSPYKAAVLSFVWPGLGHVYSDRIRPGALFAIPTLAIAFFFLIEAMRGLGHLAVLLITPSSALTIFMLVIFLGVWRVVAIADSMIGFGIRSPWRTGGTALAFAVLAGVVIVTHLVLAYVAWAFYDAGSRIFTGDVGPDRNPSFSDPSHSAVGSPGLAPTPNATPVSLTSRINVLLIGVDSASERTEELTDTLLVVSVDPVSGDVAMISFPRDIAGFELPDGRSFKGKINSLMTYAKGHPNEFPDGPLPTVISSIGYLLGSPIHYYASIDLDGFRRMIDLVGGVTVDNPTTLNDPRYDWLNDPDYGFYLSAGVHTLDGVHALAYVRSRQGLGDNDFNRARRQQQVLFALRDKLIEPAMIVKLPELLDAAADSATTNFPSDQLGDMVDLASQTIGGEIRQVVLGPPYAVRPKDSGGVYFLKLDMAKMATLSVELFGDESRYAAGN